MNLFLFFPVGVCNETDESQAELLMEYFDLYSPQTIKVISQGSRETRKKSSILPLNTIARMPLPHVCEQAHILPSE